MYIVLVIFILKYLFVKEMFFFRIKDSFIGF